MYEEQIAPLIAFIFNFIALNGNNKILISTLASLNAFKVIASGFYLEQEPDFWT